MKPTRAIVLNASSNSITIQWNLLPSVVKNGKLFGYRLCYKQLISNIPCKTAGYVDYLTNSYTIYNLNPYTDYHLEVSAGTIAGYGPPFIFRSTTQESRE